MPDLINTIKDATEVVKSVGEEFISTSSKISEQQKEIISEQIENAKDIDKKIVEFGKEAATTIKNEIGTVKEKYEASQEKKHEMNFRSVDSLQQVVNVVNEANYALNDSERTMVDSPIQDVLVGTLGAGIGGIGSFSLLYSLGIEGLSAVGITSGLAAAGSVVGGGMVAGIFVLAAPIAALTGAGILTASVLKSKALKEEKNRLYEEALRKHEGIIEALKNENEENKERLDYLQSLNLLLQHAIKDLASDIELGEMAVNE